MSLPRSSGKSGQPLSQEVCDRARKLYQTYDWDTACALLGISSSTLSALKNRGFQPAPRKRKPVPSDFAIVAHGRNQQYLMAHYQTTGRTITRWRQETGVQPPRAGIKAIPVPDDFVARTGMMSRAMLAEHYGVCADTIRRWRNVTGTSRTTAKPIIGWADRYHEQARAA